MLVEIKDADIKHEGNAAQLDNYLKFIKLKRNKKVQFLFLSRTVPPENEERKLQKAKKKNRRIHEMQFRHLYKSLRGNEPFSKMLREYLEDINVAYHDQKPDQQTLQYVTMNMLGLAGRRVPDKSLPDFFSIVFDDLAVIGQWVQGANGNLFKQGLKRRLLAIPWHDVARLEIRHCGQRKQEGRKD